MINAIYVLERYTAECLYFHNVDVTQHIAHVYSCRMNFLGADMNSYNITEPRLPISQNKYFKNSTAHLDRLCKEKSTRMWHQPKRYSSDEVIAVNVKRPMLITTNSAHG